MFENFFQVLSFFWQVKEMEELTIEQGHVMDLTQNKEMSKQIDRIRAEWAADMEEMIYLGWITTCLQHEISITNKIEERKHAPKLKQNILPITFEQTGPEQCSMETKEKEQIMDAPVRSDEIQECNEMIQCHEPVVEYANSIMEAHENCMDAKVTKGGLNSGKPKIMHKLKGWAKGKGKCKRS
jgi:hypothetical protein